MDKSTLHITRTTLKAPGLDVPLPRQVFNIQRRGARVRLRAGAIARLHIWDVTLVDLSRSGVLVEHIHRVRVNEVYQLSFQLDGLQIKAKAQTVRSFVSHRGPGAGADRQLLYRTGMEFVDLSPDTIRHISAYLDRLRASDLPR
jgi:hypothetical protein